MAIAALVICLTACLLHLTRIIRLGKPKDFARQAPQKGNAVFYAFTGAMSPAKKESAYLHLPTYTAGILYHLGTFLSFFLFFFILADRLPSGWFSGLIIAYLLVSTISGIAIFIKRIVKKELRYLSNPDDFISNFLVTSFQFMTLTMIFLISPLPIISSSPLHVLLASFSPAIHWSYYFIFILLTLYTPIGKLRHLVYFFAARYHLGYFFGWRGVWPSGKVKN